MIPIKPVSVPQNAFKFCSFTMLFVFLLALIMQQKVIVVAGLLLLIASAVLRIERAPLILLYQHTLGKVLKSEDVYFDEHAILFAHLFASVLAALALILLYFVNSFAGWCVVFVLVLAKTSAFFGYCGAAKLYGCLNNENGNCCNFGKRIKGSCRVEK